MHYISNIENTVVKKSLVHGLGLFATKKIKKDTLLCSINGQIMSVKDFYELQKEDYPKKLFVEKTSLPNNKIMLMPFRTSYGFINHDDNISHTYEIFNEKTNSLEVYASVDIEENMEILYQYDLINHIDMLGGFKNSYT